PLETDLPALPAAAHLEGPAPPGAQVSAAYLPRPDTAGAVPRRPLRPHRPRPLCRVSVHGPPVEVAVPNPKPPGANLCRAGGVRLPHLHPHARADPAGKEAHPTTAVPRATLRGPGRQPGRRDASAVRPARTGRLRQDAAPAPGLPARARGLPDQSLSEAQRGA